SSISTPSVISTSSRVGASPVSSRIWWIAGAVRDQHLARIDHAVAALDADFDQILLDEHRHAAGDDPAVLLVNHAGDVRRKNLFGRPAQHLFAWQTVIVLAGAIEQNVAGLLRAFCEDGDRDALDDGVEERAGPE